MFYNKIFPLLMLVIFGWGVVLTQAKIPSRANSSSSIKPHYTMTKAKERINVIEKKLDEYREDDKISSELDSEIAEVEEKLTNLKGLIKVNQVEGQLSSRMSLRKISNEIADIDLALWMIENQT